MERSFYFSRGRAALCLLLPWFVATTSNCFTQADFPFQLEHQVERLQKVTADGSTKVRSLEYQISLVTEDREQLAIRLDEINRERDQLR